MFTASSHQLLVATGDRETLQRSALKGLLNDTVFFRYYRRWQTCPDEAGTSLPDINAARRKASVSLAILARNMGYVEGVEGFPRFAISVRTSDGPVYETVLQGDLETRH